MKRVLVTGASGFIGRHTLRPLVQLGYEVHGVARHAGEERDAAITWHRADLLSAPDIAELVDRVRPSHLLHFAWYVEPGNFWSSAANLQWLAASLHLVRSFAEQGGARAVVAGSCAEYDWRYGYCREQLTPLIPSTLYGSSKHALHVALHAYSAVAGFSLAWGRIFFLFGPYEPPTKLVASVTQALLSERKAPTSQGMQLRDFMHVQDVASAFAAVLDSDVVGPVNIASGTPTAVRDLVGAIGTHLKRVELIDYGAYPSSPNEPALLVGDSSRLRHEVGWKPQYTIESGLEQTITWWRSQLKHAAKESR